MAFDDLDLEFEDEEEAKKKKNEAVQVDVDLEFSTPDSGANKARPNPTKPSHAPAQAAAPPGTVKPGVPRAAPVTNLNDARAARPSAAVKPSAVASGNHSSTSKVVGNNALQEDQYEVESQQIIEMREHVRKVEFEAEVKVAVAEYKTELLSELLSDTKLMQHQVEQLLIRINAKHPDLKQEVLLIKKILADFNAKKRK